MSNKHSGLSQGSGTDCNPVRIGGATELLGDPAVRLEKPHTIVRFPGGDVEIARCDDGSYWVHVGVRDQIGEFRTASIIGARLDADGRYAEEINSHLRAEIARGDVNHIAFRVRAGEPAA